MTTFAIIYDREDLSKIAAEATNPGLTGGERNTANRYWNGGVREWASAPYAGDALACVEVEQATQPEVGPGKTVTEISPGRWRICDPDIRAVVVTGNQVSKSGLVEFLRLIGNKYPGALYMTAIADDLEITAVEPWP